MRDSFEMRLGHDPSQQPRGWEEYAKKQEPQPHLLPYNRVNFELYNIQPRGCASLGKAASAWLCWEDLVRLQPTHSSREAQPVVLFFHCCCVHQVGTWAHPVASCRCKLQRKSTLDACLSCELDIHVVVHWNVPLNSDLSQYKAGMPTL